MKGKEYVMMFGTTWHFPIFLCGNFLEQLINVCDFPLYRQKNKRKFHTRLSMFLIFQG